MIVNGDLHVGGDLHVDGDLYVGGKFNYVTRRI